MSAPTIRQDEASVETLAARALKDAQNDDRAQGRFFVLVQDSAIKHVAALLASERRRSSSEIAALREEIKKRDGEIERLRFLVRSVGPGLLELDDANDMLRADIATLRAEVARLNERLRVETVPLPTVAYTDDILRLESKIARLRGAVDEEREACAMIADSATLSSDGCMRDGGCEHPPCVTARLIAADIRARAALAEEGKGADK